MLTTKTKRVILWSAVALAFLVATGAWMLAGSKDQSRTQDSDRVANETPTTSKPATPTPAAATKPKLAEDVPTPTMTYSQAVTVFRNERVVFGQDCSVSPEKISIKNGATIMFDNRGRDAVKFSLEGQTHEIPGYGFKLFQLSSTDLPHAVKVECGDEDGSGEIILE